MPIMKKKLFYLMTMTFLVIVTVSCDKEEMGSENQISTQELSNGVVELKSGVSVEKKNNDYFIEGDILLSTTQYKNLNEHGVIAIQNPKDIGRDTIVHPVYNIPFTLNKNNVAIPRAISISPSAYNLWAMVRFVYNSNLTSSQRAKIKSALLEIEASTNVRFYNATGKPTRDPVYNFDYPYVDFVAVGPLDISSSYLGRIGGRQQISLANFAFDSFNNRTIIHEINHALGLRHEHTRLDRNNYITLNTSNLTPAGLSQFQIPPTNYYQTGIYDYNSIMGYGSYTSSPSIVHNVNLPMFTKLDGAPLYAAQYLSNSDRSWMNYFHLPYIAREDVYRELAPIVYKSDNTPLTEMERLNLQAQLNNGNPNPPSTGRIPNDF